MVSPSLFSCFLWGILFVWGLPAQAVFLCSVTSMRLADQVSSFSNSCSQCVVCFKEPEAQHLQLVENKEWRYPEWLVLPSFGQQAGGSLYWRQKSPSLSILSQHLGSAHCVLNNTLVYSYLTPLVLSFVWASVSLPVSSVPSAASAMRCVWVRNFLCSPDVPGVFPEKSRATDPSVLILIALLVQSWLSALCWKNIRCFLTWTEDSAPHELCG